MFDRLLRTLIEPPINALGRSLARRGVTADLVTLSGAAIGAAAGVAAAMGTFELCLILVALNRLFDGLDGAVARATRRSDLGGYLDIVADYIFYISVPLGFGLHTPDNLTAALVLTASFTLTAATFLAFAAIAAQRGDQTQGYGPKSFFYSVGLAEGSETIIAFVAMCLFPAAFPIIAFTFAGLCALTVIQRSILARLSFKPS